VRIVFFGTPEFAASILEDLVEQTEHEVVAVISKPNRQVGRGRKVCPTPVKSMAECCLPGVRVLQPEKASVPEVVEELSMLAPDLFLVVAYGEILKPALLQVPSLGAFNIHTSLLPAYRGAAPIQRALMDGCRTTGVTIFRLDPSMDTGDIVWTQSCDISEQENAGELTAKLLGLSKKGVSELLALLEHSTVTFDPQPSDGVCGAPKISREELCLDPFQDIQRIYNFIRALTPVPGPFFWVDVHGEAKRLKVYQAHLDFSMRSAVRKWVVTENGALALVGEHSALVLDLVQLEGRKKLLSDELLRGIPFSEMSFRL